MNLQTELNREQLEAVTHDSGPLIVFAGAGTGKTRVITYRIAYLINEKKISPSKILAITFTNKAAQEMKTRVESLVGVSAKDVWLSTFHSFCARVLRIEHKAFGLPSNFTIYDEDEQKRVIKEVLRELNLINSRVYSVSSIAGKINRLKDQLIDADSYALNIIGSTDIKKRIFSQIYELYQKKMKLLTALDFGDLILTVVDGFRGDTRLLEKYQQRFQYILVDEYQDTNLAQYFLVKYLAAKHRNICIVGDDDQSIYSWRGANKENIINIQKDYPDCKVVKLEENYRSTPQILRCAVSLISNNTDRHSKSLWTRLPDGDDIVRVEFDTEIHEAQFVASEIKNIYQSCKKIAVLYRMNAQSRVVEDALRAKKIPYRVVGTVKFYERAEIKNFLSYLRLISNPNDEVALKRVINVPSRGIGTATIEKLQSHSRAHNLSLFQTLKISNTFSDIPRKISLKLQRFFDDIIRWQDLVRNSKVSDVAITVLEESGYLKELQEENTPESLSRLENLKELVSAIAEFEELSEDKSLEAYLSDVALTNAVNEIEDEEETSLNVILTTAHLAKGLEFDVVFLIGLEEGTFPHASSKNTKEELEEERRLCYVAITRARHRIYLTNARSKVVYGKVTHLAPSRFLKEAMAYEFLRDDVKKDHSVSLKDSTVDTTKDISEWRVGSEVRHPVFGEGIITSVSCVENDFKLVIRFYDGKSRKFYARYANLTKIV